MTPMALAHDAETLIDAENVLAGGGCVAVPTDTVYGLAAALNRPAAVHRLFEMKNREESKAVAVLVGSLDQAAALGSFDGSLLRCLKSYWPGPLTVVTQRVSSIEVDLGGDSNSIGLRWARSELLDQLISRVGPLVTTSANRSGLPTLSTATEIAETFGLALDLVIDDGPAAHVASTVIDIRSSQLVVLRQGAIAKASLRPLIETHSGLGSS